ncbi:MAG: hypothetical protein JWP11_792 [Frankiales bacterium]|nr:hypothetical protein [Frankiales bacterium]
MRGLAVSTLAVGLAAVAVAAPASAGAPQTASYTGPAGVAGVMRVGGKVQGGSTGAAVFQTRRTDRAVSVSAVDASGRPVRLELAQDGSGKGFVTDLGSVCGRSAAPTRLAFPGSALLVYVVAGDCSGAASVPTTGTVTAVAR